MDKFLAGVVKVGPPLQGEGTLGQVGNKPAVANHFAKLLSLVIGFMTLVAILWGLFVIVTSAYNWMTAAGDSQKIAKARQKIGFAILGIFITVLAVFLVAFASQILFATNLLDLGQVIDKLQF